MQYPLISEYVKAIQDAGDNLDKLAYLSPVLDDHGEPYRSSGAFAVVFKMLDKSTGKYYALKCFTEEQEGRADAYRQIADELGMVDSPYITSVKYMEKELFVDSQCEENEFPVLLMDWVDGETMEVYIAANYHNQSAMSMLCYRFGKMAAWLRTQSFAHGDIKPDNIIIRPDGSLVLVDYDGMFVPAMKGSKSPTVGTKDFCHPLRTVDDFDETIDDFSLASIALSLKAISMNSTLLDIYGASDRLLFSENDCRNPSNSKVISALQELMCDKDFCTLYSLFMLALARKELSLCSFKLFISEKPLLSQTIEDLSTKATEEELKEAFIDEWGVKYSKDGRKLLKAPSDLKGDFSFKEGTKIICDSAFSMCNFLTSIIVPNSVTSIGEGAFSGCILLFKIIIPNSVTSIGDLAFMDSNALSHIVISNSVTSIGDGTFYGCSSLTNIVIPDSVTSIGDIAFSGCRSLSNIVIPDSVTSIGDYVFEGCTSLSNIVIPDNVTSIGSNAFKNCSSLSNIVIPDSVTSIGNGVFSGCLSLKYISIPVNVICLNGNPFSEWNGKLDCLSPNFVHECDILFNKDKSEIISFRNQKIESYIIFSNVKRIGDSAFSGCRSLSNIIIPDSVTSIGDGAFYGCSSLTNIVLPDSVTSIGSNAFRDCSSLSNIVIPDSVTSIGDYAFEGCASLSDIVVPDSVTSIGSDSFRGCRSLSNIVIPDNVTSIGSNAFRDCSSLSNIVISDSVTNIGDWAFVNCNKLPYNLKQELISRFGDELFNDPFALIYLQ
ncbi:leucine-rich repeat protein [Segatella copri]|uniref:leucine-rich repeat protein n=1 Tax=Segatella copri TaxID=165179 RepID=UPI003F88C259